LFGKKRPAKTPIGINTLRNKFNGYRNSLGVSDAVKLYSFKHTGATMLHMSGNISMRELMDQLRHTRLDATQHYVKKHSGTLNTRIRDKFPAPI
jgi:integrase